MFAIILCIGFLVSCGFFPSFSSASSADVESPEFTAMVWNVQLLFDGEETGGEYPEFREAAGWTDEKYQARLTAISQAIKQIQIPDLIGLVEVENAGVLEDLASGALSKSGYNWIAFTSLTVSSMGIGVLSRFPLVDVKAHSITVEKDTAPRPVLEVRVEPNGRPLVFLLCHWKSKVGNNTEVLRRYSARVVQRRLRELKESEPDVPVIVMGDLNENHDELYRLFIEDIPALYSPWEEMEEGSFYYKGGWETIDHFLLSEGLFTGSGWDFSGCRVLNQEPFTTAKGVPNAYMPRNGGGLSDHLPLVLYLAMEN